VEGDVKRKRLEILVSEEVGVEEITRIMNQIGFPVEG